MNKEILLLNQDGSPISLLPVSTINWKEAVNLIFDDEVSIIEEYSDWVVHSPSIEIVVPSIVMLRKYIKVPRRVQFSRENIYLRDRYSCCYCGHTDDTTKELTLDHVIPKFHGGKSNFTNIVTACHNCNAEKAHYMKMRPKKEPRKPSYFELVSNRKNYELFIPDKSWIPYLDWNESKIIVV